MKKRDTVTTRVRIPIAVHKELWRLAIARTKAGGRVSLSAVVREALQYYLENGVQG